MCGNARMKCMHIHIRVHFPHTCIPEGIDILQQKLHIYSCSEFLAVHDFVYSTTCLIKLVFFNTAGKEAMTSGVGAFNKAASCAYEHLSVEEKEKLRGMAESSSSNEVTPIDVQHRAASVFKKNQESGLWSIFCLTQHLNTMYIYAVQRITRVWVSCCSIWILWRAF